MLLCCYAAATYSAEFVPLLIFSLPVSLQIYPRGQTILFIIPVPNWALLPLLIGGSAYAALYSSMPSTWAHAAHLGGALTGLAAGALLRMRYRFY